MVFSLPCQYSEAAVPQKIRFSFLFGISVKNLVIKVITLSCLALGASVYRIHWRSSALESQRKQKTVDTQGEDTLVSSEWRQSPLPPSSPKKLHKNLLPISAMFCPNNSKPRAVLTMAPSLSQGCVPSVWFSKAGTTSPFASFGRLL